ncbi:hypothetical protein EMIT0P12_50340 [Pseudomonas sp. IT-P12]
MALMANSVQLPANNELLNRTHRCNNKAHMFPSNLSALVHILINHLNEI